mmetsp:Transcript_18235/g.46170  ORF Transcript_18235/g.46170 Transcript_18235/m.46170 type:complete len:200 (+) Transcript_18235:240-839(+)
MSVHSQFLLFSGKSCQHLVAEPHKGRVALHRRQQLLARVIGSIYSPDHLLQPLIPQHLPEVVRGREGLQLWLLQRPAALLVFLPGRRRPGSFAPRCSSSLCEPNLHLHALPLSFWPEHRAHGGHHPAARCPVESCPRQLRERHAAHHRPARRRRVQQLPAVIRHMQCQALPCLQLGTRAAGIQAPKEDVHLERRAHIVG